MTVIQQAISALEKEHGSLREVARIKGIDVGYLSRLKHGKKLNPSDLTLSKLGIEKRVTLRMAR